MDDATILSVRIVALQSAVSLASETSSIDDVKLMAVALEDHLLGDRS